MLTLSRALFVRDELQRRLVVNLGDEGALVFERHAVALVRRSHQLGPESRRDELRRRAAEDAEQVNLLLGAVLVRGGR